MDGVLITGTFISVTADITADPPSRTRGQAAHPAPEAISLIQDPRMDACSYQYLSRVAPEPHHSPHPATPGGLCPPPARISRPHPCGPITVTPWGTVIKAGLLLVLGMMPLAVCCKLGTMKGRLALQGQKSHFLLRVRVGVDAFPVGQQQRASVWSRGWCCVPGGWVPRSRGVAVSVNMCASPHWGSRPPIAEPRPRPSPYHQVCHKSKHRVRTQRGSRRPHGWNSE